MIPMNSISGAQYHTKPETALDRLKGILQGKGNYSLHPHIRNKYAELFPIALKHLGIEDEKDFFKTMFDMKVDGSVMLGFLYIFYYAQDDFNEACSNYVLNRKLDKKLPEKGITTKPKKI